jgi:hypothetical protein
LEQAALLRRDFITLALRIDVEKLPPELRSLREEMEIHREEAARAADEAKNMKPSKFRRRKIGAGSDRVWGNAQMRALLRRQPPTE